MPILGKNFYGHIVCHTPMSKVASTRLQSAQYFSIFNPPLTPPEMGPWGCAMRQTNGNDLNFPKNFDLSDFDHFPASYGQKVSGPGGKILYQVFRMKIR